MSHKIGADREIKLNISFSKTKKDKNDIERRPDYILEFHLNNYKEKSTRSFKAYIDAKYRNYNEQGKCEWTKDLKSIAYEKFYKGLDSQIEPSHISFIVHPNADKNWVFFGGYVINSILNEDLKSENNSSDHKNNEGLEWQDNPTDHRVGIFALVPGKIIYFKTFMKMILEYHLQLYDYC